MPRYRVVRHEVVQPLDPSYRLIPLTQGRNAIVDCEDFARLSCKNWYARKTRGMFYVVSHTKIGIAYMHREILGVSEEDFVDHWNHDGLDNRKCNLRKCTEAQNARNGKKRIDNTSGYRGVAWDNERRKWRVLIAVNRKVKFVGRYESSTEAARAYDEAAIVAHGNFASLNFPRPNHIPPPVRDA